MTLSHHGHRKASGIFSASVLLASRARDVGKHIGMSTGAFSSVLSHAK